MERMIEVHLKKTVWQRLSIELPEDEDPKEFIDDLIKYDPSCVDCVKEEADYMEETAEAIEAEYYMPDEDFDDEHVLYANISLPIKEVHNLMVLIDSGVTNQYQALNDLKQQSQKDGNVHADDIVQMKDALKGKLSVNDVLTIIGQ